MTGTGTGGVAARGSAAASPVAPAVARSAAALLGLVLAGGAVGLLTGSSGDERRVPDTVAGVPGLLDVVREATGLGSPVAAAVVLVLVGAALLLDGWCRLAAFVAVTGLGAGGLVAGTAAVLLLRPRGACCSPCRGCSPADGHHPAAVPASAPR